MYLFDRRLILRYAPALFLLVSAALLLTAYLFQHIGGLHPCPLCVAQRYPHFAVLGLALAALLFGGRARWALALLLAGIAIAYLVGAGYAAFHVGVENGYFQSGCAGAGEAASSIEELRARIMNAPLARCDDVAWTLIGVSMAGWNGIVCLALGLAAGYVALLALLERRKPSRERS
jgi:disulfide bond formation protein DsbB